ncbi:MAG: flagellar basal body protein [Nocardioidaceae bacterium]
MLISASDPVGAALHSALDSLSYRQRVTADNIANADTPDFTAKVVDFEGSLAGALSGSYQRGDSAPSVSLSTAQRGANGNNVDVANETLTAMQATFSYQLLSRAVGDRFGLVSTAIGGM